MKKLMIAAVIVCAAAFAQAASYNWNAADSSMYGEAGNMNYPAIAEGTVAYFAFVEAYSQADLVADYVAGTVDYAKFASGTNNTVNSTGGINDSAVFTADYTSDQQVYFAIFEAATGNLFVSSEATATYIAVGASSVNFADQTDVSDWEAFLGDAKAGYSQAGWYKTATAPIPEPTSGLLMLLGMAGLALRRKQK